MLNSKEEQIELKEHDARNKIKPNDSNSKLLTTSASNMKINGKPNTTSVKSVKKLMKQFLSTQQANGTLGTPTNPNTRDNMSKVVTLSMEAQVNTHIK